MVINMKDISQKANAKEEADLLLQKAMCMKENGLITRRTEKVLNIHRYPLMLATGGMICNLGLAKKNGLMEVNIRGNTRMEKNTEKGYLYGLMAQIMRDSSEMGLLLGMGK